MLGIDMDLKQHIGVRVRQARKTKDLTQEQLAEAVHKYPETISNIERGRDYTGLKLLERVADTLEVPISHFFENADKTRRMTRSAVEGEEQLKSYATRLTPSQLRLAITVLDSVVQHFSAGKKAASSSKK